MAKDARKEESPLKIGVSKIGRFVMDCVGKKSEGLNNKIVWLRAAQSRQ